MIETYRGLVMANEVDSNRHMNVQYYTTRFDQAGGQFVASLGIDLQQLKEKQIGFAYVEMNVKYVREVLEDDPIHIISSIGKIGSKVVSLSHKMYHSANGTLCAEAETKWLLFDLKARKSILIPDLIKQKLHLLQEKNEADFQN